MDVGGDEGGAGRKSVVLLGLCGARGAPAVVSVRLSDRACSGLGAGYKGNGDEPRNARLILAAAVTSATHLRL